MVQIRASVNAQIVKHGKSQRTHVGLTPCETRCNPSVSSALFNHQLTDFTLPQIALTKWSGQRIVYPVSRFETTSEELPTCRTRDNAVPREGANAMTTETSESSASSRKAQFRLCNKALSREELTSYDARSAIGIYFMMTGEGGRYYSLPEFLQDFDVPMSQVVIMERATGKTLVG